MFSNLNYIPAREEIADLARAREQARVAQEARSLETASRPRLIPVVIVKLRRSEAGRTPPDLTGAPPRAPRERARDKAPDPVNARAGKDLGWPAVKRLGRRLVDEQHAGGDRHG